MFAFIYFSFLNTVQEIGWEKRLCNDPGWEKRLCNDPSFVSSEM